MTFSYSYAGSGSLFCSFYFFFQAEDGIRDIGVTGVQTCALPIFPLEDVAKALGLEESQFSPLVWNAGIYNNQRYGIPLDMHPLGLYYNRTVMEKAGLDPNKPPQTRDDYEAALKELKGNGIQGSWVSPFPFTGVLSWMSLLPQFGGSLYNEDVTKATFNSDAGVEALTWMVDLVKDGYSPKNIAQDGDVVAFQNE